jgi:hypothetical protein
MRVVAGIYFHQGRPSLDEVQIDGQKVGGLLRGGGNLLSLLRRRSRSQSRSDPDAPIAKGG